MQRLLLIPHAEVPSFNTWDLPFWQNWTSLAILEG